jgi:hypothetical protein
LPREVSGESLGESYDAVESVARVRSEPRTRISRCNTELHGVIDLVNNDIEHVPRLAGTHAADAATLLHGAWRGRALVAFRATDTMGFTGAEPCRLKDFAAEFFDAGTECRLGDLGIPAGARGAHADPFAQMPWTGPALVPFGAQAGVGFVLSLPGFLYNHPAKLLNE